MLEKKQRFLEKQEATGLLGSLRNKTPLNTILLLGDILFKDYKINEIVNKFLLAGN